jgi:hypothetical protein
MSNRLIIVLVLFFLACGKRPSDTISVDNADTINLTKQIQTDTSTVGQRNYWNSMVHRDFDNDSLLLDISDLKRLVNSFTLKVKIKEKEYGAGDYFGKYRVYADMLDTLIIDKGDGGDYGFGSTIYLKRKDSLVLYRNYEFNSVYYDSGQFEEITEQLVTFTNGTMNFKQRQMKTKDWSQLKFKINFETVDEDPTKRYKLLKDELTRLYKRELIE